LCEALCTRLRATGYAVDTTDAADEALRRVVRQPVEVAILDSTSMPRSCAPTVSELRFLSPGIKVLCVYPVSELPDWATACRAGADGLVPVTRDGVPTDVLEALVCRALAPVTNLGKGAEESRQPGGAESGPLVTHVARLAHDFNQPLTVILGTVDVLLLDLQDASETHQDLLTLQREANRLRALAAELSSLAQEHRCPQ